MLGVTPSPFLAHHPESRSSHLQSGYFRRSEVLFAPPNRLQALLHSVYGLELVVTGPFRTSDSSVQGGCHGPHLTRLGESEVTVKALHHRTPDLSKGSAPSWLPLLWEARMGSQSGHRQTNPTAGVDGMGKASSCPLY